MFYKTNIEERSLNNKSFRKILYTTPQMQLVLMSLKKDKEIGMERHKGITQFIRIEKGEALAVVDGKNRTLKEGDAIVIQAGSWHNIIALSELKLYTLYSPPAH